MWKRRKKKNSARILTTKIRTYYNIETNSPSVSKRLRWKGLSNALSGSAFPCGSQSHTCSFSMKVVLKNNNVTFFFYVPVLLVASIFKSYMKKINNVTNNCLYEVNHNLKQILKNLTNFLMPWVTWYAFTSDPALSRSLEQNSRSPFQLELTCELHSGYYVFLSLFHQYCSFLIFSCISAIFITMLRVILHLNMT